MAVAQRGMAVTWSSRPAEPTEVMVPVPLTCISSNTASTARTITLPQRMEEVPFDRAFFERLQTFPQTPDIAYPEDDVL